MKAPAKLATYALVLAAMLAGGAALGAVAGPIDVGGADAHASHGTAHEEDASPVGGVLVSDGGYTFVPEDRLADPGPFAFVIAGPDGSPVRDFDATHGELHFIVASRDLQRFAHLHPARDATGRWTAELPLLPPGSYRAFADFRPTGSRELTLGVDLVAPGPVAPPEPLTVVRADTVGDLVVSLDGDLVAGRRSTVIATVRRDGVPVRTDPYLGAAGHLVALRQGDLGYLHVHPLDDRPAGPVRFGVEVPSAGRYALFLDFVVDGRPGTARFVLEAATGSTPGAVTGDHQKGA